MYRALTANSCAVQGIDHQFVCVVQDFKQYRDARLLEAQTLFDRLDVDNNGILDDEELIQLVETLSSRTLTRKQKEAQRRQLLAQLDDNDDDGLSFEEFSKWLLQVGAVHVD